jgi:dCTP deaminase
MFGMGKEKEPAPLPGAFWSRQRIAERQNKDSLFWLPGPAPTYAIDPSYKLDPERLRAASYNLLMGGEVYITPISESDMRSVRTLKDGEAFIIPPGQFAFLLTHEAVHVPDDAFAFLALRAKALKFQGLVNVSGFHIDPGYNGRLVLAVYNAGPGQIHLRQGQALFEVFFADLDQKTDKPYDKPIFSIETHFITPLAGKFETLQGLKSEMEDVQSDLDTRIHAIEREQSVVRWASALLIGAAITFGVRECSASANPTPQPQIENASHE